MKLKNLLLLIMISALLGSLGGCIFSPDEGGGGGDVEPVELPWPGDPTQVMENFDEIYTSRDIDEFTNLLHDEYKTILLSSTLTTWGWTEDFYFNKTDEIAIHSHIFNGSSGKGPDGNVVHPIASIEVDLLDPQGTWSPIPEDDPHFGGYDGKFNSHEVVIYFINSDASHRYEVKQRVIFYCAPVQENGRTKWLMLGQRGLDGEG